MMSLLLKLGIELNIFCIWVMFLLFLVVLYYVLYNNINDFYEGFCKFLFRVCG